VLTPSTALAHDIHEQILVHKRSLFLVGHTPGSGFILDDEVKSAFLPPLTAGSTLRKEDIAMSTYTPIFAKYTEEDVLAIERERERESKRKKRAGRARRGITLPDREPLKTHRSLINPVGPNGLVPLQPTEEVSLPAGTTSRRAAAIAAQANINLMSQDLPPPSPSTNHPLPAVKKHRGGPGRGNRTWRASPATSFRESSVGREASVGTPSVLGGKRSLREDSVTETVESPLHKRRNNGRGESPSESAGAQTPMSAVPIKLDQPEPIRSNDGKWRCYNCGVSEQFASRVRTNPKTGLRNLCETCCEFIPSS
jgi:SWI/SNF-related matrix-associated actin-dependent regulator of chromatin subfamily B protein 1